MGEKNKAGKSLRKHNILYEKQTNRGIKHALLKPRLYHTHIIVQGLIRSPWIGNNLSLLLELLQNFECDSFE